MATSGPKRARALTWALTSLLCGIFACSGSGSGGGAGAAGEAGASGPAVGGGNSAAGGPSPPDHAAAGGGTGGGAAAGGSAAGTPSTGGGVGGGSGGGGSVGGAASAAGAPGSAGQGGAGASGGQSGTSTRCEKGGPGAHYVDATAGKDTNDGVTQGTAWQTLVPVNNATFQPGDAICFHAGGSWTGQLAPKGSGSEAAPIVIDQYGAGNKPSIAAGSGNLQALLLFNVSYWEVNHLELTNKQSAPGDFRGLSIHGKDVGILNHIYVRDSFIHDVTGVVNWIGGDVADNVAPWVTFQTGWDDSKRTGGIVVDVESAKGTKTWFNDVRIERNVIQDTSFAGIVFKQFDGGYGWGVRSSKTDSKFSPHTNIVVQGNYISQSNSKYACNSIYVTGSQHVLIERNVCKDSGTSAIEAYNSDDVRIQHNETFGTIKKAGGADSNGIDTDRATTGAIVQYNYVHDNGDGILLCQFAFGDSIIRYNLIVNNSRLGINLHSDASASNQTYNNLVFNSGSSGDLVNSSGGASLLSTPYALRNNIFHSTRAAAAVASGSGTTYSNNLFSGVAAVGSAAVTGDPSFVNSANIPKGDMTGPALAALTGFQLKAGSTALEKGVSISGNGGADFWGNALYTGSPDIGPFEKP